MGLTACGICKNVSGNTSKNVSLFQGKGYSLTISTRQKSTDTPCSIIGLTMLSAIFFACPDCE